MPAPFVLVNWLWVKCRAAGIWCDNE